METIPEYTSYLKYIAFIISLYVVFHIGFPEHNLFLYCALFSFFSYEIIHAIFEDFVGISVKANHIWRLFGCLFIVILLVLSIYYKETMLIFFTSIFALAMIAGTYLGFKKKTEGTEDNIFEKKQ